MSRLLVLWLAIQAVAAQELMAAEYFFPQIVDGGSANLAYVTSFLFNNVAEARNEITLSFFNGRGAAQGNGTPWAIELRSPDRSGFAGRYSTVTLVLEPRETVNVYTAGSDPIAAGWASIRTTAPLNLSAVFSAVRPDIVPKKVNWEAGVLACPSAPMYSFQANFTADELVSGTAVNTGYAIANPNGSAATITAALFAQIGSTPLRQKTFPLPANGQLAEFVNETFADYTFPPRFHGTVRISSDVNVAVTVLRMSSSPGGDVFSTIAVNPDLELGYHAVSDLEPNGSLETAQPILLPAAITGSKNSSDPTSDSDYYSIDLRAGQTVYVIGVADAIASPLDIDIYLRDAAGTQRRYIVNWAPGTTDALFSQQVTTAGKYYVQVVGGSGAGSSGASYRIMVMAR